MNNMTGRIATPITIHLLIINVLLFAAKFVFEQKGISLNYILGLHYYEAPAFHWWQPITYMFMHADFGHLFNNMFTLFMFGRLLEEVWGKTRFVIYYLVTGIGAGIIQQLACRFELNDFVAQFAISPEAAIHIKGMAHAELLQLNDINNILNQMLTIGASGSVFGILLAFGMMFPNAIIYLIIPPMPLKAKWLVIGYGLFELFAGVWGIQTGVAHYAHLGGMLFGFILIMFWKHHRNIEF